MLDVPLCQKRQEGNRRCNVYILGTKSGEIMKEHRILGTIVMAAIIVVRFWGVFMTHSQAP